MCSPKVPKQCHHHAFPCPPFHSPYHLCQSRPPWNSKKRTPCLCAHQTNQKSQKCLKYFPKKAKKVWDKNLHKIPELPKFLEKFWQKYPRKNLESPKFMEIFWQKHPRKRFPPPPEIQRSYGSGVVGLPGAILAAGGLSPPPQGHKNWPQSTTRVTPPPALPAPMPVPRQLAADRCKGGDAEVRSNFLQVGLRTAQW